MRFLWSAFLTCISLGFIGLIGGAMLIMWYVGYVCRDLPDYRALKDYEPPVVTRVHTGDGRLMAEFATERRVFVPIEEIPPLVIRAFLSAEDKNFYQHRGVDMVAIARATLGNLKAIGSGKRPKGASTITQQVAKNLLLTNERTMDRKLREAVLAMRLEQAVSKDRLLELYLNQIYLGAGNYGVAAAALSYFNKSLDELTIPEAAYLAGLPKAPNNYHPIKNAENAKQRRDWVIARMAEDNVITPDQAQLATATPLQVDSGDDNMVAAPYFAEEIRRELAERFGQGALYQGGLSVRSTIDPELQTMAQDALRHGLITYDQKQGWRGPVAKIANPSSDAGEKLAEIKIPLGMLPEWRLAVVRETGADRARLSFADSSKGFILLDDMKWARPLGSAAEVTHTNQVLKIGDVVMVERTGPEATKDTPQAWSLRQIPRVQGALVAMDPHTGRVLAMQGGWTFAGSEFNRVTQAWRQPGSSFKPFIYLAALDNGFTPSSIVLDAPITFTDALGRVWQPENYSGEFYGPSTLRVGIEKSRNLMTVRLADHLGMSRVVEYAQKFGLVDLKPPHDMKPHLANALGSTETTLLRMTAGYAMLVNGGKKITPVFIDRIQDRRGKTVYTADIRACDSCGPRIRWETQDVPQLLDNRVQLQDPRTAYQMVSILEGVVQRGTATKLQALNRPVAGKTGTTNESRDAWFIGFTPDLVAGVYIGYDTPKSLGDKETGGSLAVPIFGDFMAQATKNTPPVPFRVPPGIRQVRVTPTTGRRTDFNDPNGIWEAFVEGTEPGAYTSPEILSSSTDAAARNEIGDPNYVAPTSAPPPSPATPVNDMFSQGNGDATAPHAPSTEMGTGGIY